MAKIKEGTVPPINLKKKKKKKKKKGGGVR